MGQQHICPLAEGLSHNIAICECRWLWDTAHMHVSLLVFNPLLIISSFLGCEVLPSSCQSSWYLGRIHIEYIASYSYTWDPVHGQTLSLLVLIISSFFWHLQTVFMLQNTSLKCLRKPASWSAAPERCEPSLQHQGLQVLVTALETYWALAELDLHKTDALSGNGLD